MGILADRVGRKKVIASSVLGPILQLCWILLVCRSIYFCFRKGRGPLQSMKANQAIMLTTTTSTRYGRIPGKRHEHDMGRLGLSPHGQPVVRECHDIRNGGRLMSSRPEEPLLLLPLFHFPRLRAVRTGPGLGHNREESPHSLRRRTYFSAHMLPDPACHARDASGGRFTSDCY